MGFLSSFFFCVSILVVTRDVVLAAPLSSPQPRPHAKMLPGYYAPEPEFLSLTLPDSSPKVKDTLLNVNQANAPVPESARVSLATEFIKSKFQNQDFEVTST
jgi:hypothetical protein